MHKYEKDLVERMVSNYFGQLSITHVSKPLFKDVSMTLRDYLTGIALAGDWMKEEHIQYGIDLVKDILE